jgi:hypothetical protein
MAAQAWFSSGDVDVAPGTTAVLQLTVVNLADTTDSFAITPVGMAAPWTTLKPATLTLFGGTQQVIDVEVSPPVLSSTIAGPTALSVRVVPQRDPDNLTTAETTLIIGESFDRRLHVLQPALRGRRGATYDMMLENKGNTIATCRLHLVDPSGRLDGEFDPPAAGVEPGASTLVRLKLRATSPQWHSNARTIPFRIEADQPGSPTASSPATFVQTPMVSGAFGPKGAAVAAAALALLVGWFGVVKPAIRDAARDAVRTIAPAGAVGATNSTVPTLGTDTVSSGPANNVKGDNASIPLPSSVAQGQTGKNEYTVPAGKRLRITDIVIQNPNADQGTLSLAANGNSLFTYNLSQMFADVDQPLVTPIELLPGQKFGVEVKCDGVGDLTANACKPNVFISGLLVDA